MPTPGPCKRPGVFYYFEIYTIRLFPPRLTKGPGFFIWVNGTSNGGIPKRHNAAPGGFMVEIYPQRRFSPPPYLIKGPWGYMVVDTGNRILFPCAAPGGYPIITRYVFIDKNFGFLYDYLYALFRVQRANWPNQNKPTQAQALLAQASGARRLIPRAYLENSGQAALARLYGEYFL